MIDLYTGDLRVNLDALNQPVKGAYYVVLVFVFDTPVQGNQARRAFATITIFIAEVDPCFDINPPETEQLPENITVPTFLFDLSYSSGSFPVTATLLQVSNGDTLDIVDPHPFQLTNDTVYLVSQLDFEDISVYVISIYFTNSRSECDLFMNITIDVTDVNDVIPTIQPMATLQVSENSEQMVPIIASDEDFLPLKYFVYNVPSSQFIFLDVYQPTLLIRNLDRELQSSYTVTVVVEDSGSPVLSASIQFKVNVTDENDNTPQFNQTTYVGSSPENRNGFVISVHASDTDLDRNGDIEFSLMTPTTTFSVETVQLSTGYFEGRINLVSPINYETQTRVYTFLVQAEDRAPLGERLSSVTNVTVYILDVNDVAPVLQNAPYTVSLSEELLLGTEVFNGVTGFDPEEGENGMIQFSQNSSNLLDIDPVTGVIITAGRLDRESTPEIIITIHLFDFGVPPLSDTATFTLTLLDINDNPPVFTVPNIFRSFPEDTAVLSVLLSLTSLTTDADIGGSSTHTYSIIASTASSGVLTAFTITNGSLLLVKNFDFESVKVYRFTLEAFDGVNVGLAYAEFNITDINDNAPVFDFLSYKFYVTENNLDMFVGQVIARDLDSGINREIEYILSSSGNRFYISSNGTIRTNFTFDRETVENVSFVVTARDGGSPRMVGQTTVDVCILDQIDVAPKIVGGPFMITVSEDRPIDFPIFTFMVVDPDLEVPPPLSLSGAGSSDFTLVGYELRVNSSLDRDERQAVYSLTLTARDSAGLTDTQPLTINLIDVNDNAAEFEQQLYGFVIPEESTVYNLGQVAATDIDIGANANFLYFIKEARATFIGTFVQSTDCVFSGNSGDVLNFGIDRNNGSLFLSSPIDYETVHFVSLSVCTMNTAMPFQERCICVVVDIQNINDVTPQFIPNQVNIDLVETQGSLPDSDRLVTFTSFVDLDGFSSDSYILTIDHTYGSEFPFTLRNMNNSVREQDGSIEISRDVVTLSNVDREFRNSYQFDVCVFDGIFEGCLQVSLTVLDVNDNPPIFTAAIFYMSVNEHEPVLFPIDYVTATDADIGNFTVITYNLLNGTEHFSIDIDTGLLSVAADIDREPDNNLFILRVQTNNIFVGVPHPFGVITSTIHVSILDINDNRPQYIGPLTNSVDEDLDNQLLFNASATDADIHRNAELEYFIVSDPDDSFLVDQDGLVYNKRLLIRDERRGGKMFYTFTLLIRDNGVYPSQLNTTYEFNVTALDVNSGVPVIQNPSFTVYENEPSDTCFGTLEVDDIDFPAGSPTDTQFTTNSTEFSVGLVSGLLCTTQVLDREFQSAYSVAITLTDLQPLSTNTTQVITVSILDINDNSPYWLTVCPIYVQDSVMRSGDRVFVLGSQDPDLGPALTHRIVGSDFGFSLQGADLYPPSGADVSDTTQFWLTFSVDDTVHPVVLLDCTILVTDLNNYDPILSPAEYTVTVIENIPVDSIIVSVSAVDLDEGLNGNVYFELWNELATFSLDSDGELMENVSR